MRIVSCSLLLILCCATNLAAEPNKLPPKEQVPGFLQSISVNLKGSNTQGSGTLVVVPIGGKSYTFVWTCAHVVKDLRQVKEVIAPDGTKRQLVTFKDAKIVQEQVEEGRRVGEARMDARVVVYSEKEDLALLRVRKRGFSSVGAVFYTDKTIPAVGSDICHCGSPGGQEIGGAASYTTGVISQVGRTFNEYPGEYDQVDCAAMGGSSGGMVTLDDGRYVGMISLGVQSGDNFHWMIPIRRIRAWARKVKVEWALGSGPPPTEDELKAIPIEDAGTSFGRKDSSDEKRKAPELYRPVRRPGDTPAPIPDEPGPA